MADVIQVYTDGEGQETGRMEYMGDYVNLMFIFQLMLLLIHQ